jgi:type VI secretion system protein ImpF
MPRIESDVRTTPSVLDRLIDLEPGLSSEPPASRHRNIRQLKDSVRRDLEWLLNSRRLVDEIPVDLKETRRSLAAYGLPDFTGVGVSNPAEQNSMRRLIQTAIETFEPRLKDVAVTVETGREFERSLHFRIAAYLQVEPAPEPVTFDTTLQPLSTEFKVQEEK